MSTSNCSKTYSGKKTWVLDNSDYPIEIINNKARHNLINAKCRWRLDQLDGGESFWEPLGQRKVMQIRQRKTQIYQWAITNEICCLSAQLIRHLITPQQHHNSQPMLLLENTQCTGTTFFPYAEKIRYKSRRLLCDVKFLIVLANYPNLANAHLHISTSNPGHSFLRN